MYLVRILYRLRVIQFSCRCFFARLVLRAPGDPFCLVLFRSRDMVVMPTATFLRFEPEHSETLLRPRSLVPTLDAYSHFLNGIITSFLIATLTLRIPTLFTSTTISTAWGAYGRTWHWKRAPRPRNDHPNVRRCPCAMASWAPAWGRR